MIKFIKKDGTEIQMNKQQFREFMLNLKTKKEALKEIAQEESKGEIIHE